MRETKPDGTRTKTRQDKKRRRETKASWHQTRREAKVGSDKTRRQGRMAPDKDETREQAKVGWYQTRTRQDEKDETSREARDKPRRTTQYGSRREGRNKTVPSSTSSISLGLTILDEIFAYVAVINSSHKGSHIPSLLMRRYQNNENDKTRWYQTRRTRQDVASHKPPVTTGSASHNPSVTTGSASHNPSVKQALPVIIPQSQQALPVIILLSNRLCQS